MLLLAAAVLIQTQHSSLPPVPAGAAAAPAATAVRAARVTREITLDAMETEEVWRTAPVLRDFREARPREDADPRFPTEARIAYDEHHLYVFVRAFDPHPDSIITQLGRRDGDLQTDWINVYLDSYLDRRSGFRFAVNPSGVKVDAVLFNDGQEDWAWDGVWEVEQRIDSLGWSAEFKIPLSQLRYPAAAENTFGLAVRRYISRYTSEVSWPLYRASRPGNASQFGDLTGLQGLAPPRRVELTPYLVTRNVSVASGGGFDRRQKITAGGDLKYAVASNLTLTGTANPDFGQVEADPSVLNLGAFETFFRERRPFFVEGTGLFRQPVNCFIVNDCNTGEGLFYSRRIGRPPQLTGTYPTTDAPTATSILGAAKLTGRSSGGLSVGLLDAVTERVNGGVAGTSTLEPITNYGVLRVVQDLRGGESNIGAIATGVNRWLDGSSDAFLRRDAYVGGVDFFHRFPGRRYQLTGQVNASRVTGTPAVIAATQRDRVHYYQRPDAGLPYDPSRTSLSGYSSEMRFAKFGGDFTRFETAVGRRSPGFEINDLGFLRRADEQNVSTWFALRWRRPALFYQQVNWNFNTWLHWTTGGLPISRGFNTNVHVQFNSRWWLHTGGTLGGFGPLYCDRCSRGGPALRTDMTVSWWGGIEGDNRRAIRPNLWANYWRADGGRTESWNVNPSLNLRFGPQVTTSAGVSFTRNRDHTQWFSNVTETGSVHYLFAHLEQQTLSLTWRADVTFSPTLTLQVYAAPFVSRGDYSDLRELAAPRAPDYQARFRAPTLASPPVPGGFNFKEFRSNVVFRWEYRPGSVLFLVWQQGRQDSDSVRGSRTLGGDLTDLFDARANNAFLLKASYWINW